jgi:hypothetical protein
LQLVVIADLDLTCFDASERFAAAGPAPHWSSAEYRRWVEEKLQPPGSFALDRPVVAIRLLLQALADAPNVRIAYVTGRSRKHEEETRECLHRHGFPLAPLFMRDDEEWNADAEYKPRATEEALRFLGASSDTAVLVLDDDFQNNAGDEYLKKLWTHAKVRIPCRLKTDK